MMYLSIGIWKPIFGNLATNSQTAVEIYGAIFQPKKITLDRYVVFSLKQQKVKQSKNSTLL